MEPPPAPRHFTLAEANGLLPHVRRILEELQARAADLNALQRQLPQESPPPPTNGHRGNGHGRSLIQALQRLEALVEEMRRLLAELEAIGCEVKDVQTGLVDFRTLREGREVYLCWRLGEDEIRFWHELDTGFSGRQPL